LLSALKPSAHTHAYKTKTKGTVIGFHTYSTGVQQWLDKPNKKDFKTVQILFTLPINIDQ